MMERCEEVEKCTSVKGGTVCYLNAFLRRL